MALNIPLPEAPPGGFFGGAKAANALTDTLIARKFKPLDMAIKTQNALSYNNRMGNIGLFLRSLSQMPVEERQAYLSNPQNRENYMAMMETFRQGINNPMASGNILSPEYVGSFFGSGGGGGQGGGLPIISPAINAITSLFGGNQKIPEGQQANALMQQPNQPMPMQAGTPIQTEQGTVQENIPPVAPSTTAETGDETAPEETQEPQYSPYESIKPLSEKERDMLSSQLLDNNKKVSSQIKKRADSAEAFDLLLQEAHPEISKAFNLAFKYNGIYGRGTKWLDILKKEQPEKYAEYIKAKNSIMPVLSNGIRFMEDMGISHDAQEDARRQTAIMDSLQTSPEVARKVFNSHLKLLEKVSNGVMRAAQPAHPGVREKLAGIRKLKGDYIPTVKNPEQKYGTITLKGGLIVPKSFDSQKDYEKWFYDQPIQTQKAYNEYLKGK